MSISVSGLGSGIDYESWITQLVAIKQAKIDEVSKKVSTINDNSSTLTSLQDTYTKLLTSIQKFTDAKYNSTDNIFTQKKVTSSSDKITAKVDASANIQSVKVTVSELATATKAQSATVAAYAVDANTLISDISEGSITAGKFSIYINGAKNTVNVTSTEKLGDVINDIKALNPDLNASVTDGKLTVSAINGTTVSIGSNADTSNFADVFALTKNLDGSYTSSKPVFETNTATSLTSAKFANGTVTAGTFTIGGAEFTIDGNTTIDGLIKSINTNKDAGVSAYWDQNAGKLVLEATDEGAVNINVEAGTSNFTDIIGLTSAGSLAVGSQTLGTNAKLTINGTEITSSSNTVTSDISGITGLTLTLNDKTTSTANVEISSDNSATSDAISSFITAFNDMMTKTNVAVGVGGNLHGESILSMIENSLRGTVTASVTGANGYKTLASIGITTGKWSTDTSAETNQLVLDKDSLTKALQNDPDSVMKLLIGDKSTNTEGVLTKLETILNNNLDPIKGYFVKRESSYSKEVSALNKTITSMKDDLTTYKAQLETKFQAMDKLISNLKSQAQQMDSLLGLNNKNNNSNSSSSSGN